MILELHIDDKSFNDTGKILVDAWNKEQNKVFLIKSNKKGKNIRDFYEKFCSSYGKLFYLAEDVRLGNRDEKEDLLNAKRYDPKFVDAYRHSSQNQPLHTDGSYIPNFPNATFMCCVANTSVGGETIFVDANEVVKCLENENKELLNQLLNEEIIHERSGDKRISKIIYKKKENNYLINFNYFCISKKNDKKKLEMAEKFFNFLNYSENLKSKIKQVKLTPGDAVTWKDQELLHGRNSFKASENSERFLWKCAVNIGIKK